MTGEDMKNYYQILGLGRDATLEEIKKAYRLYATKYHPDKQGGDTFFEDRFKEIKEAYDILSDPEKRTMYDASFDYLAGKTSGGNPPRGSGVQRPTQSRPAENVILSGLLVTVTDNDIIFRRVRYPINEQKKVTLVKLPNTLSRICGIVCILSALLIAVLEVTQGTFDILWMVFIFVFMYFGWLYAFRSGGRITVKTTEGKSKYIGLTKDEYNILLKAKGEKWKS